MKIRTKTTATVFTPGQPAGPAPFFYSSLCNFKIQALIVAILSLGFYANTFQNEFAFDDNMVILRNTYVWQGVAGIPGILANDTYASYYSQNSSDNVLAGGRYRPLSVVTFAIEQQFLGAYTPYEADSLSGTPPSFEPRTEYDRQVQHAMHIRHVFNVLWFTLSVVVLLYFLRQVVLKNEPLIALLAAVLFTIHPIHTEVVANVKSRDEILSLLFICLTFIFAFEHRETGKKRMLYLALGSYSLAFLSKEYAICLVALLPLSFYLFNKDTVKKSLVATLPYLVVVVVYFLIRLQVSPVFSDTVDNSIANNAYAYASPLQKVATEISTALNYLRLLLFPHPLSSDYSYNTIPYKDISHPLVWLSILVHFSIVLCFFYFLKKRSVLSFAIAFYLLNLMLVGNFFFNIGSSMGERLIYHSSVGFVLVLAWLVHHGISLIGPQPLRNGVFMGLIVALIGLCGFKTITRNRDWKNNFTLALRDIETVPNSFLMNGNMAINYLNKSGSAPDSLSADEDVRRAINYFSKAISINDEFIQGYDLRGGAYCRLGKFDSALNDLNRLRMLNPSYPGLAELYFNVGVLFYKDKQYEPALAAWQRALALKPEYVRAQSAINTLYEYKLVPGK